MTDVDIGARLRASDPLVDDPAMSRAEVDAMRRAVVAAADRAVPLPAWWPPLLAVVATAAAMLIAVVGVRMRETPRVAPERSAAAAGASSADSMAGSGRRQMQFATPGGTRVIWVFDPEFNP